MDYANKKAPGIPAPEANANGGNHTEQSRQSTLFDLLGIAPVLPAVPVPDDAEHCEIAERVAALYRFLQVHPGGGTFEAALDVPASEIQSSVNLQNIMAHKQIRDTREKGLPAIDPLTEDF